MSANNSNGAVEQWRDIEDSDGPFKVSNLGRIKVPPRTVKYKDGRVFHYKSRVTKGWVAGNGYYMVGIRVNGRNTTKYVHVLMMNAFVPKPDKGKVEVNHRNGIKTDNKLENLEWVTHRENMIHSIKTGLRRVFITPALRGEQKTEAKMTNEGVLEMRRLFSTGNYKPFVLATMFHISPKQVRSIVYGKAWKHLPGAMTKEGAAL